MIDLHVIGDVDYYQTEKIDPTEFVIPDVDLVIMTGNFSYVRKTFYFIEELTKRYPHTQFIVNLGILERVMQKYETQMRDGLYTRQKYYEHWPKNLHYRFEEPINLNIKGRNLDILCTLGFPHIDHTVKDDATWRNNKWYRFAYHGITHDQNQFKPKMASDVYHGWSPIWSTPELCRADHDREVEIISTWVAEKKEDSTQILVSALGPNCKEYLGEVPYKMYDTVRPDYWVAGGEGSTETYILSNSGRGSLARSKVFSV